MTSVEEPEDRCGLAWTDEETAVLLNIIEERGFVSEAFERIGRGQDAIKRKWRKLLADQTARKTRNTIQSSRRATAGRITEESQAGLLVSNGPQQSLPGNCTDVELETMSPLTSCSDLTSDSDYLGQPHLQSGAGTKFRKFGSIKPLVAGAACDDCRRRHKKCAHRARPQKHTIQRRSIQLPRAGSGSSPGTAQGQGEPLFPIASASGLGVFAIRKQSNIISPMTANQNNILANVRSMEDRAGVKKRTDAPTPRRIEVSGWQQSATNAVKLTANGKRRGRPPKKNRHRSYISHCVEAKIFTNGTGCDRPATKRRSIGDYEYSQNFERFILGECDTGQQATMNPESKVKIEGLLEHSKLRAVKCRQRARKDRAASPDEFRSARTCPSLASRRVTVTSLLNDDDDADDLLTKDHDRETHHFSAPERLVKCPGYTESRHESVEPTQPRCLAHIRTREPAPEDAVRCENGAFWYTTRDAESLNVFGFPSLPVLPFRRNATVDYDDIRSTAIPPMLERSCRINVHTK